MREPNKWNADSYNKNADFVSNLALPVVELLKPQKDEKILDLGCGEGTLAQEIQKYKTKVIGVDLSADMVAKSKEKGIEAYQMAATDLAFEEQFDAVFSNAVLHWVIDAAQAIKEINRVLKSRGRFIAEFGGDGNIKALRDAMKSVFQKHPEYGEFHDPWFFPTTKEYRTLLEQNRFTVKQIELIKRPTPIDEIKEWLDIFANGIMQNIPQENKKNFKLEVEELLRSKLYSKKDGWVIDYVRIRFFAIKVNNKKSYDV